MIPARHFSGQKLALFGLGGSGLAAARSLLAGGAEVLAWDDSPARVVEAEKAGVPVKDLREAHWSGLAALVLSPGVPLTHPRPHWTVELARRHGVPVIGDIELFCHELSGTGARLVAITGTNGKSTTTALIAHLLAHAGRDTQMGGNIGQAALTLDPPQAGRHYVIECSSYQIDLAPSLAPDVGILLNLSPDHLDRHGTLENYATVKERLVAASRHAIVAMDDPLSCDIAARLEAGPGQLIRISKSQELADGYFARDADLIHVKGRKAWRVASLAGIGSLRGSHNAQNALAAFAACSVLGLSREEISAGLSSFAGLAHRMEQVARKGKVLYVNDSKATNVDAASLALASFERIYWIAGGLPKEGGFEALRPCFPRIARAYLIGEAAPALAAALGDDVPYEISGTLEIAVRNADRDAAYEESRESVILLSPGCASFDQFRNFEARGDCFKAAVMALEGMESLTADGGKGED